MNIVPEIAALDADMRGWRHHIHAHPETAFEEHRTSGVVAEKLKGFGIEVHQGLAGTGVVGTLKSGKGGRAIALRADMDALHMPEANGFAHASKHNGKMHACGHDGHTTMLLGAARYLAETKNFDGTVHFIFQPAEENEGGGRVMVEQGLFEKFPVEAVYGMHNWPGLPPGKVSVRSGPTMAAFDIFEIAIQGKGTHGAMPHLGIDPIVVAAEIVLALQTIASRVTDPLEAIVVSVTQMHGGDTWNVIPDQVVLRGTARAFKPEIHDAIEGLISRIAGGICQAHGASFKLRYRGLRLDAAEEARLLHLDRQWRRRRRLPPSQPALRFQRRDPARGRELLGEARGDGAGAIGAILPPSDRAHPGGRRRGN
jgi:hippurate hydrolase